LLLVVSRIFLSLSFSRPTRLLYYYNNGYTLPNWLRWKRELWFPQHQLISDWFLIFQQAFSAWLANLGFPNLRFPPFTIIVGGRGAMMMFRRLWPISLSLLQSTIPFTRLNVIVFLVPLGYSPVMPHIPMTDGRRWNR